MRQYLLLSIGGDLKPYTPVFIELFSAHLSVAPPTVGSKAVLGAAFERAFGGIRIERSRRAERFCAWLAMEGQTQPDTITPIIRCMNIRRPFSVARP